MTDSTFTPSSDETSGRLRADVHRAVGGTLGLLRECSRIMHHLDRNVSVDWAVKRVQFLSYELQTWIREDMSATDRLGVLNEFFYSTQGFCCWTQAPAALRPLDAFNLTRAVTQRSGHSLIMALIYTYLGEKIGLSFSFIDFKPAQFLKWNREWNRGSTDLADEHSKEKNDQSLSKFIDLTRRGAILSADELLELMHDKFASVNFPRGGLLETYTFEGFLVRWLEELRSTQAFSDQPEMLLFLQNALIEYQPSNLLLLAERAILLRRLGQFKAALSDLKRYFAFYDREKAPADICKLFDDLVVLLDRHRAQIEFTD